MQRRHFEAIAETIREWRDEPGVSVEAHARLAGRMADMCRREYRGHMSFDRDRFLRACGVVEA